jgi:hypothetical protein
MKGIPMKTLTLTAWLSLVLAITGCTIGDSADPAPCSDDSADCRSAGDGTGDDDGGGSDGGDDGDDGDDGTGTGTGTSTCSVAQNSHRISCTNGACVCFESGQQVGTCTAPDPASACSSPGNCCGF